jgi:hypothetical protein
VKVFGVDGVLHCKPENENPEKFLLKKIFLFFLRKTDKKI